MSRLLSKFPPGRAESSTVRTERTCPSGTFPSDTSPEQVFKARLRAACDVWKRSRDATREQFADALGIPFLTLKQYLSNDESRRVPPNVVLAAEELALKTRTGLTDQEIAQAVIEHARAEATLMRIRSRLLEATA